MPTAGITETNARVTLTGYCRPYPHFRYGGRKESALLEDGSNRIALAVLAGAALLAATLGWIGRYETTPAEAGHFYATDRWTGTVLHCAAPNYLSTDPAEAAEQGYGPIKGGCIQAFPHKLLIQP
jgi:hypothetical protein